MQCKAMPDELTFPVFGAYLRACFGMAVGLQVLLRGPRSQYSPAGAKRLNAQTVCLSRLSRLSLFGRFERFVLPETLI